MRIISFTGPKGSGKDTCADILKAEGISLGKISFAGPMRKMFCELFELDPIVFDDRELKEAEILDNVTINAVSLVKLFALMEEYLPMPDGFKWFEVATKLPPKQMKTPRELLQYVGTEIIRKHINPAWHIEAAFSAKGLEGLDPEGIYCVTDARFPNEYEWLNNRFMLDFTGLYVNRPEAEETLKAATHDSELQVRQVRKLMKPDQILDNSGTLDELKRQILGKI